MRYAELTETAKAKARSEAVGLYLERYADDELVIRQWIDDSEYDRICEMYDDPQEQGEALVEAFNLALDESGEYIATAIMEDQLGQSYDDNGRL